MLKRLMSILVAGAGLASPAAGHSHLRLGNAAIAIPEGWQKAKESEEQVVLRSPDGRQQATISLTRFNVDPTFDQFRRICQHCYDAEKREVADTSIEPSSPEPSNEGSALVMLYFGVDKKNHRLFRVSLFSETGTDHHLRRKPVFAYESSPRFLPNVCPRAQKGINGKRLRTQSYRTSNSPCDNSSSKWILSLTLLPPTLSNAPPSPACPPPQRSP
jgi:hypothetical protein